MKKIKVMLSVIAVLAVVGGALAFKASKFSNNRVYKIVGTTCAFDKLYDPVVANQPTIEIPFATVTNSTTPTIPTALCQQTTTVKAETEE